MNDAFEQKKVWILDGGLATEVERRGCDIRHPMWSARAIVENARVIYDVHRAYLSAGADIILTASYQASILGFMKHFRMHKKEAETLLIFSTELACRARQDHQQATGESRPIYIGGSIGPYGAVLADGSEYRGDYDLKDPLVKDYYQEKSEILSLPRKNYSIDFLAFETLPTVAEAKLILDVIKKNSFIRAWFSFSKPAEAVDFAKIADKNDQVLGVGINCIAPANLESHILALRKATKKLVMVYPNAGGVYDPEMKAWSQPEEALSFQNIAGSWIAAGANIIGGCCGTGPTDITALKSVAP